MNKTQEMMGSGDATLRAYAPDEVALRQLTELTAEKMPVLGPTYFDGGDIMMCLSGSFRFTFGDGGTVTLKPGEVLVTYPGNTVAIDSLKPGGRLRYAIVVGSRVDHFFSSFGFCDRLTFKADGQEAIYRQIVSRLDAGQSAGALSLFRDALITFARALRAGGRTLLFDAIAIIQCNLSEGGRLKPVFDQLQISRATLHRLFVQNGFPAPGEFLRREQYRQAALLLKTTALPVGEIARRVGIDSTAYFTAFIRKFAHATPSELRQRV